MVRLLIQHGADVNLRTKEGGHTPLYLAAAYARADVVLILLASGADPKIKDQQGLTAMEAVGKQVQNDNDGAVALTLDRLLSVSPGLRCPHVIELTGSEPSCVSANSSSLE